MFNVGMLELVVVLVVAFVVVGPEDLPKIARWIARQIKSLKKLIREIKKETGWDEFAKELRDTADDVKSVVKEADIRQDVQSAADELRSAAQDVQGEVNKASEALKKDLEV